MGEAVIHDRLGLDPLGNVGIKTGGATGGSTLWEAVKSVASRYSDCVLAMGWERIDKVPTIPPHNGIKILDLFRCKGTIPPCVSQWSINYGKIGNTESCG